MDTWRERNMKIAVDILPIRPDGSAGGATGFALELIKGFASRQGIQVVVLCGDWNIKYLKGCLPKNVQFCQVAGQSRSTGIRIIDRIINRIKMKMQKKSVLAQNKIDILYCPFSAATYGEKGIPTVSTILDIQHEYYPQFFEPAELNHRRKFYQDIVKSAERVICISDYTKKTFCEKYGFPESKAQTVYIAIQNRFLKEDDTVLDRLDIRGRKYIAYPANFWEHKNHKLLLTSFGMYHAQDKDMKLVLTGNTLEQREYYEALLKALNLSEHVVITGYVNDDELHSILKNAKGLIYPSLFEGFGIPVVEAMHLHKLIACSNLTSLPEIGCGEIYYFNPKKPDDILKAICYLADNEMTEEILLKYEEKLQEYKTDKMVDNYLKIFEETIEKREEYIFHEEVAGIYEDGWSSGQCVIQLKNRVGGCLKMRVVLPQFVGMKEKIILRNNNSAKWFTMNPGDSLEITEKVHNDYTTISFRISKTWSPKAILKSEDKRNLGVLVESLMLEIDNQAINLRN